MLRIPYVTGPGYEAAGRRLLRRGHLALRVAAPARLHRRAVPPRDATALMGEFDLALVRHSGPVL
ncbi:hypothetical protein [Streptomyces tremellae]|uniref:hypothetical protein n=1 Tax=Streptomyces tremellae TaxID=1124239 RepID=UPI0031EBEE90